MALPVTRLNLVEEVEWKNRYDPAGQIMEWASDNAYEELHHMSASDLADLFDDILTKVGPKGISGRKRWGPVDWSREDLEEAAEAFKADHSEFESADRIIVDALTWTWEEAYMPSDGDLERAIEATGESIEWDVRDYATDELWEEVLDPQRVVGRKRWGGIDPGDVTDQLVRSIRYERKPDHYDRFIIFSWRDAPEIVELLERFGSVRRVRKLLNETLSQFADSFMARFWKVEEREREGVDVSARTNFRKHWQSALSDLHTASAAAREIMDWVERRRVAS